MSRSEAKSFAKPYPISSSLPIAKVSNALLLVAALIYGLSCILVFGVLILITHILGAPFIFDSGLFKGAVVILGLAIALFRYQKLKARFSEPVSNFQMLAYLNHKNKVDLFSIRWRERSFNFILAVAIMPLAAPFIVVLGFCIVLVDGVSPFFAQRRVGRGGKDFLLIKLQTIHPHTGSISWLGNFLRKSGIDEVPQLYNVLCGEMSLVGPRPELAKKLAGDDLILEVRSSIRPGITGLWQLSPYRQFAISEHFEMDIVYCLHRDIFLDIAILIATPMIGFLNPKT